MIIGGASSVTSSAVFAVPTSTSLGPQETERKRSLTSRNEEEEKAKTEKPPTQILSQVPEFKVGSKGEPKSTPRRRAPPKAPVVSTGILAPSGIPKKSPWSLGPVAPVVVSPVPPASNFAPQLPLAPQAEIPPAYALPPAYCSVATSTGQSGKKFYFDEATKCEESRTSSYNDYGYNTFALRKSLPEQLRNPPSSGIRVKLDDGGTINIFSICQSATQPLVNGDVTIQNLADYCSGDQLVGDFYFVSSRNGTAAYPPYFWQKPIAHEPDVLGTQKYDLDFHTYGRPTGPHYVYKGVVPVPCAHLVSDKKMSQNATFLMFGNANSPNSPFNMDISSRTNIFGRLTSVNELATIARTTKGTSYFNMEFKRVLGMMIEQGFWVNSNRLENAKNSFSDILGTVLTQEAAAPLREVWLPRTYFDPQSGQWRDPDKENPSQPISHIAVRHGQWAKYQEFPEDKSTLWANGFSLGDDHVFIQTLRIPGLSVTHTYNFGEQKVVKMRPEDANYVNVIVAPMIFYTPLSKPENEDDASAERRGAELIYDLYYSIFMQAIIEACKQGSEILFISLEGLFDSDSRAQMLLKNKVIFNFRCIEEALMHTLAYAPNFLPDNPQFKDLAVFFVIGPDASTQGLNEYIQNRPSRAPSSQFYQSYKLLTLRDNHEFGQLSELDFSPISRKGIRSQDFWVASLSEQVNVISSPMIEEFHSTLQAISGEVSVFTEDGSYKRLQKYIANMMPFHLVLPTAFRDHFLRRLSSVDSRIRLDYTEQAYQHLDAHIKGIMRNATTLVKAIAAQKKSSNNPRASGFFEFLEDEFQALSGTNPLAGYYPEINYNEQFYNYNEQTLAAVQNEITLMIQYKRLKDVIKLYMTPLVIHFYWDTALQILRRKDNFPLGETTPEQVHNLVMLDIGNLFLFASFYYFDVMVKATGYYVSRMLKGYPFIVSEFFCQVIAARMFINDSDFYNSLLKIGTKEVYISLLEITNDAQNWPLMEQLILLETMQTEEENAMKRATFPMRWWSMARRIIKDFSKGSEYREESEFLQRCFERYLGIFQTQNGQSSLGLAVVLKKKEDIAPEFYNNLQQAIYATGMIAYNLSQPGGGMQIVVPQNWTPRYLTAYVAYYWTNLFHDELAKVVLSEWGSQQTEMIKRYNEADPNNLFFNYNTMGSERMNQIDVKIASLLIKPMTEEYMKTLKDENIAGIYGNNVALAGKRMPKDMTNISLILENILQTSQNMINAGTVHYAPHINLGRGQINVNQARDLLLSTKDFWNPRRIYEEYQKDANLYETVIKEIPVPSFDPQTMIQISTAQRKEGLPIPIAIPEPSAMFSEHSFVPPTATPLPLLVVNLLAPPTVPTPSTSEASVQTTPIVPPLAPSTSVASVQTTPIVPPLVPSDTAPPIERSKETKLPYVVTAEERKKEEEIERSKKATVEYWKQYQERQRKERERNLILIRERKQAEEQTKQKEPTNLLPSGTTVPKPATVPTSSTSVVSLQRPPAESPLKRAPISSKQATTNLALRQDIEGITPEDLPVLQGLERKRVTIFANINDIERKKAKIFGLGKLGKSEPINDETFAALEELNTVEDENRAALQEIEGNEVFKKKMEAERRRIQEEQEALRKSLPAEISVPETRTSMSKAELEELLERKIIEKHERAGITPLFSSGTHALLTPSTKNLLGIGADVTTIAHQDPSVQRALGAKTGTNSPDQDVPARTGRKREKEGEMQETKDEFNERLAKEAAEEEAGEAAENPINKMRKKQI